MDKQSNWTPEPWHVSGAPDVVYRNCLHIGAESSPMVLASMNEVHTNTPANAARIVACVNACEGMEDPHSDITRLRTQADRMAYVESHLFAGLNPEHVREAVEALEAAHSALSQWVIEYVEGSDPILDDLLVDSREPLNNVRAALAKVKP